MSASAVPDTAHEETVHGAGHAHPSDLDYVKVALFLAVITGAEVAMSYIDMPMAIYLTGLLAMMTVKFAVVVLWFMHLRFDNRIFRRMFVAGIVLAVGVYIATMVSMQMFGDDTTSELPAFLASLPL